MPKSSSIFVIVTGLFFITAIPVASAKSGVLDIHMSCPSIGSQGPHIVTNNGTLLSGAGIEQIGTNPPTSPLFTSALPTGSAMPSDLAASYYRNAGTEYDGTTSTVICHFSSAKGYSPFHLTYKLNNAYGGKVIKSSHSEIEFEITLGIHAVLY